MIVCTRCGFQNEDSDTFCGSCAGFLEWSGQQVVEEAPAPEPEPEPVLADPEHAGFIERVKDRIGIGDAKEGDQVTTGDPAAVPVSVPAGGGPAGAAAAAGAPPSAPSARAMPETERPATPPGAGGPPAAPSTSAGPTPVAPPPAPPAGPSPAGMTPPAPPPPVQPAPVQPTAVQPAAVKARPSPRSKVAPSRVVNPGDLICGQCGEGNDPARKFCRRCGASLQEAEVFNLPWYSRWWRKLTTRKTRVAGERPKVRRRAFGGAGPGWLTSWVTRLIVLAVIVVVILSFVGPWSHSIKHRASIWYHDVVNVVHPTYNAVHPTVAAATSSAPGHPATLAIDGANNTSWQSGPANNGVGQSLTLRLAAPSNIDKIGFLIGDTDTPQAYLTEPRPELIRVTFSGPHPYTKDITLKDTASFQTYTVKAKDATEMTVTIDSVYLSSQGKNVAITEVELFKKS